MGVLLNCLKPSKKRYTQINEIVIESKEKKRAQIFQIFNEFI